MACRRPRIDVRAAGNVVAWPPEPRFPAAGSRTRRRIAGRGAARTRWAQGRASHPLARRWSNGGGKLTAVAGGGTGGRCGRARPGPPCSGHGAETRNIAAVRRSPSKTAGSGDAALARYVLPADLEASPKYLDDAQLDALVSTAGAKAPLQPPTRRLRRHCAHIPNAANRHTFKPPPTEPRNGARGGRRGRDPVLVREGDRTPCKGRDRPGTCRSGAARAPWNRGEWAGCSNAPLFWRAGIANRRIRGSKRHAQPWHARIALKSGYDMLPQIGGCSWI